MYISLTRLKNTDGIIHKLLLCLNLKTGICAYLLEILRGYTVFIQTYLIKTRGSLDSS